MRKLFLYPEKLLKTLRSHDKTCLTSVQDLFIFIISVFLIVFIHNLNKQDEFFIPFPEKDLYELRGELTADSVKISTGKYIYSIAVKSAVSRKNITVFTPDKKIKIISRGENLDWGDSVRAELLEKIRPSMYAGSVGLQKKSEKFFYRARRAVKKRIDRKIDITGSENGLTLALLTGSRIDLMRDDVNKFRKSGCSHLLALSGMHLGIISFFFYCLIKPAAGVRTALVSVNIINVFYLFISGFSPSLLRACILSAVLSYTRLSCKKPPLSRSLFLTFLINVLITPGFISDLSFQYSYLALAGIVLYAKPFYRILLRWIPPFPAAAFSCSLSAQLFTAPLSAYTFGEIFPSGIIASVLITPVITLFMWTGLISLLLPAADILSPVYACLKYLNNIISVLIIKAVSFFSTFPPLSFNQVSFILLIIFNLSVMIVFTVPDPKLKMFKRYR